MSDGASGNLLVLQGGGPTPVLNTSLYGVLDEASRRRAGGAKIDRVLGARWGVHGLICGELIDLTDLPRERLERLRRSPGAALGSTRHKPSEADLEQIIAQIRKHEIRALLMIGGNGSMRGAEHIAGAAQHVGYELSVIGVPKTIDNDIASTDRCPGFGSAARYVAQSVRDLGMDVQGLPQPVSIYETMGRSVGWLAGAAMLARRDEDDAPHLVYLPERAFDLETFLADVDRVVTRRGWCIAALSEGIRGSDGAPVYETGERAQADALGRPVPGGAAMFLAELIAKRLKIRCRYEKPGLCGRTSMLHASAQDLADAELVGRAAVHAALAGHGSHMVALRPLAAIGEPTELVQLSSIGATERVIPAEWLGRDATAAVNRQYLEYVDRIVGPLVDYDRPLNSGTLPS